MSKKYLLIVIIIFLNLKLDAQIDKEISSFIDSTELIVNNGRKLLIKSIKENNYQKSKQIYTYLKEISLKSNCRSFTPFEEFFLNTLISDWETWIDLAKNSKIDETDYCSFLSYDLIDELYSSIETNIDILLYNENNISNEDRMIIDIYLHVLKYGNKNEQYLEKLEKFKDTYDSSDYNDFIKYYLPAPGYKGAFTFYFGTSSLFINNNLSDNFSAKLNFVMGMDLNYHKVFGTIYFAGGSFELKNGFSTMIDNERFYFEEGDEFNYTEYGILLGYFVKRSNRIQLAPYVSLSGSTLKSNIFESNDDREDDEYKVLNTFTGGLGFRSELKLFDWDVKNSGYYDINKNYISIRMDVGYNWISSQSREMFKGDFIYFRPALVWGIGDF